MKRKIVVTGALPYANGDIHLGHLVEYLQADFWARFQKMRGHECLYICADDTHGTPIMVKAREMGITPEELIATNGQRHIQDFKDFEIVFDNYSSTNTETNRHFSEQLYQAMLDNNRIECRSIEQAFDEEHQMFLPDRFVKGTCPKCKTPDQYGDSCDKCGATYSPMDLEDAVSTMSGAKPTTKESEHVFFRLNDFKEFLEHWIENHTQPEVCNKLKEWFEEDLRDWDISRDAPYFGFEIPDKPGKYFYVWVDAPVGYISSTKEWCDRNGKDVMDYWSPESSAELYHIIGKDIIYFHTLFWPAILKNAGFKIPDKVWVHGMLMINGEKMSKSKGTFINARTFLNHMAPRYLRYYYACKMGATPEDIDLSFDDFTQRVNSDLIGKITNLASRGAQMLHKKIDGRAGKLNEEGRKLVEAARNKADTIAHFYENREFSKAIVEIRGIADDANQFFDEKAPWKTIKEDPEAARDVLTTVINVFRIMAIYLKPVMPTYVDEVEELLQEEPFTWSDIDKDYENREISKYKHLASRIERSSIDAMVEETKQALDK